MILELKTLVGDRHGETFMVSFCAPIAFEIHVSFRVDSVYACNSVMDVAFNSRTKESSTDFEMAPAPAMDVGAACSDLGMSGAVFCSTLLLSLLALLKH
ncbi:hypothetical protein SADUNF_Sadunf06G0013800 [Salix dunnii]|uniref:Uncharacterized protein n=1 Tax=Salix dunnii TaxID=1413687 RepID=A0A835JXR7_9ROSI|nr:hypothetical protein SADUNF_Sadunf06G0013800 [Salix dunnii]